MFKANDSLAEYRVKRDKLITSFKYDSDDTTTIYTFISCFTAIATDYHATAISLVLQKAHFTSFVKFLTEFEQRRWPWNENDVFTEWSNIAQYDQNEGLEEYFVCAVALCKYLGKDKDSKRFPQRWIQGIRNGAVCTQIRNKARWHQETTPPQPVTLKWALDRAIT